MPFNSGIGIPSAFLGGSQPSFGATALMSSGSYHQLPYLKVQTDSGTDFTNAVDEVTITHGLDIGTASAVLTLNADPGIGNDTVILIDCGAGAHNARRFRGTFRKRNSVMWPYSFTMNLQGMLANAARYQQATGVSVPSFINQRLPITGQSLADLLQGSPATDENIVLAYLNAVQPAMNVDPGDIDGTHHVFGSLAWRDMQWAPGRSALAQILELDTVCLGFRTFEGFDGRIMRKQVYGYPNNTADTSFTEGIDIWEATGTRSVEDVAHQSYVEGYALGGVTGLINAYVDDGGSTLVDRFSSALIEDSAFALQVANWRITERDRELVNYNLVTFRDDIIFPGHTLALDIPHAAINGEKVWVQRVEIKMRARPVLFQQTIAGLGGGIAGSYPVYGPY